MVQINFHKIEEEILKFWEKNKIFEKSLKKKSPKGDFIFYEGPPTANGTPHIGHALTRIYKDVVLRYRTMRGFRVPRKAGWDTQGLPVELEVERELKLKGKPEIETFGIEKFNARCRKSVWRYKDEWEKMTERIGFWLEMTKPYITYEKDYIETLWWIIERIWEKGLLYQDYKVVPYCPRCGTTLSSHELAQGYENIEEESVYLKFKIANLKLKRPTYLLVWTTTPWTLAGNVALAINKNVYYVKILKNNEYWILAKERLGVVERPFEIVDEFPGEKLLGTRYEPLFEFVHPKKPSWFVIHGDFVSIEDGTGIVHIAPAFGEEDMEAAKANNLEILVTVETDGKISPEIKPWAGKWVKDADPLIVEDLRRRGILVKREVIRHDYPFCWRCETPLIYYAKLSWFIKVSKVRDILIKNNETINWIPAHIKEGRFGQWLCGAKDWAISRERYWGTPLPIWECEGCGYRECIGSFKELGQRTRKKIPKNFDPHRPFIDSYTWACPRCARKMKRVPEVLDCWFDSGAMPFAQNPGFWKKLDEKQISTLIPYPADFICEAVDQTRGWFYSLLAISTLLGYGPSYQNVISLEHVLDAKGEKMSKSKGNVISAFEPIEKYGADSLRWYFYTVSGPGEAKAFNLNDLKKMASRILMLYNIFEFYKLYADKKYAPINLNANTASILDKWILAKLNLLIKEVSQKMDTYDITAAARILDGFIGDFSQWYLRRSRDRFSGEGGKVASQILGYVLINLVKLLAPFIPFTSEKLYLELARGKIKDSVHLEDWPEVSRRLINEEILSKMETVRGICEVGHALRARAGIKVRQPLKKLKIKNKKLKIGEEFIHLIKDELNVKEVEFTDKLPDGNGWIISEEAEIKLALSTKITPELKKQGLMRELTRYINALRKEAKLTKKDLVNVYFKTPSKELRDILVSEKKFFKSQTMTKDIIEKMPPNALAQKEFEIQGQKITMALGARHRP